MSKTAKKTKKGKNPAKHLFHQNLPYLKIVKGSHFFSQILKLFTKLTNINCDNFRSCGDTNSSSTKLDLIQITFEEPIIENPKEDDTIKETKGTGML